MINCETYTYCERLKNLRKGNGWSLQQAAIQFGVTKQKLNSYETKPETFSNGVKSAGREAPIAFLLQACEIYKVTLDYLCGRATTPAPTLEEGEILNKYGIEIESLNKLEGEKDMSKDSFDFAKRLKALNICIKHDFLGELSEMIFAPFVKKNLDELHPCKTEAGEIIYNIVGRHTVDLFELHQIRFITEIKKLREREIRKLFDEKGEFYNGKQN